MICVITPQGEKQVWVRCQCEVMKNEWKKYVGIVGDGGKCVFQVIVNLTKGTIIEYSVSGLA